MEQKKEYLRNELNRKRNERQPPVEYRNEEKFRKRTKFSEGRKEASDVHLFY